MEPPRILVLEDELTWQNLITNHLNLGEFKIDRADTVQKAKALFEQHKGNYDLLICDLKLSKASTNKNPFEDLEDLRFMLENKGGIRIPIIIVTGHVAKSDELTNVLNRYPGWIWGWHEKAKLNRDGFRKNVMNAIQWGRYQQLIVQTKSEPREL